MFFLLLCVSLLLYEFLVIHWHRTLTVQQHQKNVRNSNCKIATSRGFHIYFLNNTNALH